MKKLGIAFIIIIGFILLSLYFDVLQSQQYLQRLHRDVERYTTINIDKNYGLRKQALSAVQSINRIIPPLPTVSSNVLQGIFDKLPAYTVDFEAERIIHVANEPQLRSALEAAQSGDLIALQAGEYELRGHALVLEQSSMGTVHIKGAPTGLSVIKVDAQVGFALRSGAWIISDLVFSGVCDEDARCQHAIHINGDADHSKIVNNVFKNFDAAIKSNGRPNAQTGDTQFADFVTIANNRFYNEWVRESKYSVTPVDVVGGDGWRINANFIADFAKRRGNQVAYAAFLKGAGRGGIFADNVVACSWQVPYFSALDVRVGLSFGGGATEAKFCQDKQCTYEHTDGIAIRNTVVNCHNDVAIYVNKASNIEVTANTLIYTAGIDVTGASQQIQLQDNHLHGLLRVRGEQDNILKSGNQHYSRFDPIIRFD